MPNFFQIATGLFSPHEFSQFWKNNIGGDNSAIFGGHHSLTGVDYATLAAAAALGGYALGGVGAGAGAEAGAGDVAAEGAGAGAGTDWLSYARAGSSLLNSGQETNHDSWPSPPPVSSDNDPQFAANIKLLAESLLRRQGSYPIG